VLPTPQDALEKVQNSEVTAVLAVPMVNKTLGKFFEEMCKIKGIQLKSEVVMDMGIITTRSFKEATEVVIGPIPASVFELPKGYEEQDAGKKELDVGKKELDTLKKTLGKN